MTSSQVNTEKSNNSPNRQTTSDFSIEHILNRAGSCSKKSFEDYCDGVSNSHNQVPFPWLQYTRYCPPKIPRNQKREGQKRQLGTHPRIPFSSQQLAILEKRFQCSPYLSSEEVGQLSRSLHLPDIRVKIWFQNRRARERRERKNKIETDTTNKKYVISNSKHLIDTQTIITPNNFLISSLIPLPTELQINNKLNYKENCDDD